MYRVRLFHRPEDENGYLSNWYPSEFTLDGVLFRSMEQYMMYQKAVIFGDSKTAKKILEESNPEKVKALGREVSDYNDAAWSAVRQAVVYRGLLAKFGQNAELKRKLLDTGDDILAECAFADKVWGIGVSTKDPGRANMENWKGQNLLGASLMMAREALKIREAARQDEKPVRRDLNKFRGCMIGGAAGDALGYAVEFRTADDIFREYGPRGITEYKLRGGVAEISDDTQMTLFTANGLLFGDTRVSTRGIGLPWGYLDGAYRDWYRTQRNQAPKADEYYTSWLLNVPGLYHTRAPGNTCMSALSGGRLGTIEEPINHSKGCGGVMRVAPVGLFFAEPTCYNKVSIETSDRIAAEAAALTHGHELGYIPAAALAHIVRRLAENERETVLSAVTDALNTIPGLFPGAKHMEEFVSLTRKAVDLSASGMADLDAIRRLGKGWVAEETLAIAVYCALKYETDFERGIIAAVNHDGDSDSTGAVAGNILGARLGYGAIPRKFTENLELRSVILEIADDLFQECRLSGYGTYQDPLWESKYIQQTYQP